MSEIWAKRPEKDGRIITLRDHVMDILKSVESLMECSFIKSLFENRSKYGLKIKKEDFERLLKYAGFFHDLGKVSPHFQIRKLKNEGFEPDIPDFPDVRHNILSLFFINKDKVREICREKENLYATFLSAVAFHHWKKDEKEYILHINEKLIKACRILLQEESGEKTLGDRLAEKLKEHFNGFDKLNNENPDELISFDKDLAKHIADEGNLISADIIPPYTLYFLPKRLKAQYEKGIDLNLWVFLAGFLMRVDHFASMVESKEDKEIDTVYIERKIDEKIDVLERLKEKKGLTDEQLWQKHILEKDKNIILIAPTGIGKTEFAFAWGEGEKFFYTLPLRVATNQIFDRACEYFNEDKKQNKDPYIEGNVGLLHSDADLYLIEKSEISKDNSSDGETLKILELAKYFSLPVNICTGDQIFPAGLKYPGYEKVYATLGYSKLIIDEVQAYDPRACAIVVKMIEDIVSLGGKFLLMTATLPEFVRKYLKEREIIGRREILDLYDNKIKPDLMRHKIRIENRDIASKEVIEEIIKKAGEDKRILVILNTVKKAERVFEKIKSVMEEKRKDIFVEILHSRLTMNKRKRREKRLEEEFKNPKPMNEKQPKILVATQVVEASLDIDADYLFTEICPMDSLIQRMGRVMRRINLITGEIKGTEKEFNYKDFYKRDKEANVIVYTQHKEDNKEFLESGRGYVYEIDLLCLTLGKLLKKDLKEIADADEKKYRDFINRKIKEYRKDIKDEIIEVPEKDKNEWVCEVYESLNTNSQYFQKFYGTLPILEAGYVSENQKEAHEIFREIYTLPVIEEKCLERLYEKIEKKNNIDWLWFKREIIAEFVIHEHRWKYKESQLESLWERIKDKVPSENAEKLKKYCRGIYVVKADKKQ